MSTDLDYLVTDYEQEIGKPCASWGSTEISGYVEYVKKEIAK